MCTVAACVRVSDLECKQFVPPPYTAGIHSPGNGPPGHQRAAFLPQPLVHFSLSSGSPQHPGEYLHVHAAVSQYM